MWVALVHMKMLLCPIVKRSFIEKIKANRPHEESFFAPPFNEDLEDKADACIQKSLSVFDDLDALVNAVFRTQAGKEKGQQIASFKTCFK